VAWAPKQQQHQGVALLFAILEAAGLREPARESTLEHGEGQSFPHNGIPAEVKGLGFKVQGSGFRV